jgi:hypothetical protein
MAPFLQGVIALFPYPITLRFVIPNPESGIPFFLINQLTNQPVTAAKLLGQTE